MRLSKVRRRSTWKGVAAGLVGGLAGSWAMTLFQQGWSTASEKLKHNGQQRQQQSKDEDSEDATMKAAGMVYEAVFGEALPKDKKKSAAPIVHYAFGSAVGGMYGAAVEYDPRASYGAGVPFGTLVFAAADEVAVPALGLSNDPTEYPLSHHAYALASHAVYGVTTEAVRRLTRNLLRKV